MSWMGYIPMGIWLFVLFFGYVGTIVCLVREQRAWKRQKIKDTIQQISAENTTMSRGEFLVGNILLDSTIQDQPYYAVFEDDGDTGYFYVCDHRHPEQPVIDALHIYDVQSVSDKEKTSLFEIMWSTDRLKTALFINGRCHAIFDFAKMEGRCRSNFPNSQYRRDWSDELVSP